MLTEKIQIDYIIFSKTFTGTNCQILFKETILFACQQNTIWMNLRFSQCHI